MARRFTTKEAKQLLQSHQALIELLKDNCDYSDKQKDKTSFIISNLMARNIFSNYVIGQLSSGNATIDTPTDIQQMIHSLYKYIKSLPLSEESKRFQSDNQESINLAINNLQPGLNSIQWFFTSGKDKDRAVGAYTYLNKTANSTYAWQIRTLNEDIEQIEKQSTQTALQDFELHLPYYRTTLYSLAPALQDGGSQIPEIKQLCEKHQALLSQMDAAGNAIDKIRGQIKTAADHLVASEVLKLLKGIPIEELGREKTGVRFKALRDYGYNTIADVYCATSYNLASVHGISEDTAYSIKRYARQYAEQVKTGTKIKLSVDDKNVEATKLITAICAYRQQIETISALEEIKRLHSYYVFRSINDMQKIGNGVNWLFAQAEERQRLTESYQYLSQLINGDYSKKISDLVYSLNHPIYLTPAAAWDDFERNSISYFNILEDIVPGILGNDDGLYGLPEDLAREIQDECFFPDGLKCELRRYQEWGVKYILHQERVLLGDEMGLGKTIQAIASMVSLRNTGATHFMVVCPASVLPNWCKEIAEKSKLRVTKIHSQGRMNAFKEWMRTGGAAVTTFETTGYLKMEDDYRFDLMIVDEAHYIKNSEARRSINVKRIGEHAKRMLFMTGTALENKVDEMVSLIQILQPTIAAQLHSIAFMSSAPQFRQKVAPVYYRRKREDVLTELPDLIENKEWCMLSNTEEKLYEKTVLEKRYADIRRVSWNVDDLSQSCKAVRMKEIIEEAESEGRKIIVFSFFLDTMRKIREFLGDRCMSPINGSIPPQRRQEIIDEFDKAPAGAVLLAQIQSGGTGLNIQSASVVIICEPQLKPSIENQAISRAYRMGQARNVLVYRLLCENTIDERIMDMLAEKQAIFNAFADKSVSADATAKEEIELDDKTLGKLVQSEIDRINEKNGTTQS